MEALLKTAPNHLINEGGDLLLVGENIESLVKKEQETKEVNQKPVWYQDPVDGSWLFGVPGEKPITGGIGKTEPLPGSYLVLSDEDGPKEEGKTLY